MSAPKVVLLDADGVLIQPEISFSRAYAATRGLDAERFRPFFKGPFLRALSGEADLKDLIREHHDVWQWDGDPAELLRQWFQAEDVRNQPLVELAGHLRTAGTPCYIATNQEKYRAEYLKTVMFKDKFDGFFISSELGTQKPATAYYEAVIHDLQQTTPGLQPSDIMFFDDQLSHITGAIATGIQAHVYESVGQVRKIVGINPGQKPA